MVSGDTSANNSVSGYIVGEQITLSVTPSGSSYSWGQAIPSASAVGRSGLSETDQATATFTPDVGGTYAITCLVSGTTTYVLILTVVNTAILEIGADGVRYPPVYDSQVPAPTAGRVQYFSLDQDALVVKLPDNSTQLVNVT